MIYASLDNFLPLPNTEYCKHEVLMASHNADQPYPVMKKMENFSDL